MSNRARLIPGLSLFRRTSAPWCYNIVAYHNPRSITWSWVLSFSFFRAEERRVWPLFWRHQIGQERWGFRIPWLGMVKWLTQEPMPYRPWHVSYYDGDRP